VRLADRYGRKNETARAVAVARGKVREVERPGPTRGRACLKIMGFNPMRDRSFRNVRQAHQPAASAHDRRHDGAPVQGEGAERLRSARQNLRGLPRSVARYGDERGPSPLPAASGAATDQCRVDQRRHRRGAVLFHRDARTARPRSPSDDREHAAQGAGRAEPGGSGASPRSRARPQVQGRAQRRLRRRPAGVRGREPEGVRYRQPAHDASGRAGSSKRRPASSTKPRSASPTAQACGCPRSRT